MDGGGRREGEGPEDPPPDLLVRQNKELRRRLEEEAASYKRRLDTYRQAQQHQAALVSRLQAKVSSLNYSSYRNKIFTSKNTFNPPYSIVDYQQYLQGYI